MQRYANVLRNLRVVSVCHGCDGKFGLPRVCYLRTRLHDLQRKSDSTLSEGDLVADDTELAILEDRGIDAVEDEIRSVVEDLERTRKSISSRFCGWAVRAASVPSAATTPGRNETMRRRSILWVHRLWPTIRRPDPRRLALIALSGQKTDFDPLIAVNASMKEMCDSL